MQKVYRIHADLHNGQIGLTAWYTSPESIKALCAEIAATGATILKIEESTQHQIIDFAY